MESAPSGIGAYTNEIVAVILFVIGYTIFQIVKAKMEEAAKNQGSKTSDSRVEAHSSPQQVTEARSPVPAEQEAQASKQVSENEPTTAT